MEIWDRESIRIVQSGDERAVAALLDRAPGRDPAFERRVARIVSDVRRRGDRALLSYAQKFDGLTGDVEVTRAEMRARRGVGRLGRAPRHSPRRRGTSGTWRGGRCRAAGRRARWPA